MAPHPAGKGSALPTIALIAFAACRATPLPTVAPVASRDAAVHGADAPPTIITLQGSVPFCSYGSQGVMPVNASIDNFYRVIAIVDVTAPEGVSARALTVQRVELLGDGDRVEASMRALISVTRLPTSPHAPTWADSMDTRNTPFDGALSPGTTRLRIEAWLTRHPPATPRGARVELSAPGLRATLLGPTQGEWPTA